MHYFTAEIENVEFYDVTKKYDLMATINSLNILICYKEWRKYETCRVACCFNYLIDSESVNVNFIGIPDEHFFIC